MKNEKMKNEELWRSLASNEDSSFCAKRDSSFFILH